MDDNPYASPSQTSPGRGGWKGVVGTSLYIFAILAAINAVGQALFANVLSARSGAPRNHILIEAAIKALAAIFLWWLGRFLRRAKVIDP